LARRTQPRALLAALEVERGEDAAGGADRDELIEEKAAGARLSVEHDPAGDCGARRAGRMQMKREPRGWRDASKAFLSLHEVARELPSLCQRPAGSKSEPRRGVRMVRGGFGALKTPRRASSLPTLQRRLPGLPSGYKRETEGLHFDCKKAALGLHRGCTNAALVLHRGCTLFERRKG